MRKFTLFLMSLFLTVGAMAQDPVLELTAEEIGTEYPKQLSDDDAAKVFDLDVLTVAVRATPNSTSGRRGLFVTSDPNKAKNTAAKGTNSYYIAYGLNDEKVSYLASWVTGDRFTANNKTYAANSEIVCVYVINPNGFCKLYLNGQLSQQWPQNGNSNYFMNGYEITTPKMVKQDYPDAKIYLGGGVSSEGASEIFGGTITGVKVYSGALSAEEVAAITSNSFDNQTLLAESRSNFEKAKAAAQAILDEAELNVTTKEVALQVTDKTAANFLWTNNPETSEGPITGLIDGNSNTFFHTNWHGGGETPHWIAVDLGNGNSLSEFSFSYKTRDFNGGSDFPDAIQVLGSNEKTGTYTPVYTINSGLPQARNTSWGPATVSSENAYRFYRFVVNAERTYWHMSEFDMFTNEISVAAKYAEVANEVAALKNTSEAHADYSNYTIAKLNEATSAINALVEAVKAGVIFSYETLAKPTFKKGGNTSMVAKIELNGDNLAGFTYKQGETKKFDMPQVEAGRTYYLNLTYDFRFGDLAIFQIDKNSNEKVYGYYQVEWRVNNGNQYELLSENADFVCEDLGIESLDELNKEIEGGSTYLTFPYQITIDKSLEPGDFTVVRVMVGKKNNGAYNAKNIEEGGCLDLVFEIKEPTEQSHTLKVSNAGFSTLMLGYNSVIPSNVKAYTVSAINNGYVDLTQVQGVLPANAPVVIEAKPGNHYFDATTEARQEELGNNWLKGTLADAVIQKAEGWSYYVLGVVDGQVGFYNAKLGEDNTKFKNTANKAYLLVQGKSPIASYSFRFNEGTTNVENVVVENEVKAIYDLTGRRIEAITAPGIYIVNGKKVLVK